MKELKVYVPQDGPYGLEPEEGGEPVEEETCYLKSDVDAVIAELKAENERLKAMMPKYDQFIKDKKFKKKLVDEYDGYVYEWMGHRYIATPYINVFIKGILRALWLARSYRGRDNSILLPSKFMRNVWDNVERKCLKKAEQYK